MAGIQDNEILGKKGRHKKDQSNVKEIISQVILRNNSLTQKGISEELARSGHSVPQPAVSKLLNEMRFTRKRLSLVPQERNSARTLDARQSYAQRIQQIGESKFIFLDETGFSLHTSQSYGYSPINTKAYMIVPANRGKNISVMVAISIEGIVGYEIRDGSYNGDCFIQFIGSYLLSYFRQHPNHVLIMDNCKFHHRADVLRYLSDHQILYQFLPAYSPQLNPIEEFFGELKANYKSLVPASSTREEVKSRIKTLLEERTGGFRNYYAKATSQIPKAISRQPFI